MDAKFGAVDKRLGQIDSRFVDIENGFANIQNEFIKIEKRFDQHDFNHKDLISTTRGIDTTIDKNYSEQKIELNFLSSRMDKIEKRVFKIENKH